jgi:hypothetical protein
MSQDFSLTTNHENNQEQLKARLVILKQELNAIQSQIIAFENMLRSHLENEIIEEHELNALYKQLQRDKKEKRLAQKKRGKKFKESQSLKVLAKTVPEKSSIEDQKERKRLYREAMLFTHPDTFSMQEDKIGLATEITAKLIEIYQSGNLEKLYDYHAHICSGHAFSQNIPYENLNSTGFKDLYLEKEIAETEQLIMEAKNKHTYKVLTEYENPLTFVDELKAYYVDRIFKLKKRTRKVRM